MGKPDQHEKRLEEYNDVFADIYNTLVFKSEVLDENKLMAGPTESINDSDTDDLLEQRRDVYKHYGELEPVSKLYCSKESNVHLKLANFGIENQTTIDALMPLRTMSYDLGSYRQQINDKYPYGKPQTDEVARGSGNREYGCRRLREKLPNFSGVSFFRAGNSSNRVNAFHICVYVHRCAVPRYIALQYP